MEVLDLTPIKELTVEVIKGLTIHSTRSSIRRAASVNPMVVVPGNENVPTLYYIQGMDKETNKVVWEIHALSVEITKFLMTKTISTKTEDPTNTPVQ